MFKAQQTQFIDISQSVNKSGNSKPHVSSKRQGRPGSFGLPSVSAFSMCKSVLLNIWTEYKLFFALNKKYSLLYLVFFIFIVFFFFSCKVWLECSGNFDYFHLCHAISCLEFAFFYTFLFLKLMFLLLIRIFHNGRNPTCLHQEKPLGQRFYLLEERNTKKTLWSKLKLNSRKKNEVRGLKLNF